jgi:hypothetical protein
LAVDLSPALDRHGEIHDQEHQGSPNTHPTGCLFYISLSISRSAEQIRGGLESMTCLPVRNLDASGVPPNDTASFFI